MPEIKYPSNATNGRVRACSRWRPPLPLLALLTVLLPVGLDRGWAQTFLRGDANYDGRLSLADVLAVVEYLHGEKTLACLDAADADDSGAITTADFVGVLSTVFVRERYLPAPFPAAGVDATPDSLDCVAAALSGVGAEREPAGEPPSSGADDLNRCDDPPDAGAGAEFILFQMREVFVSPGQRNIRVPILLTSSIGNIQGITLSLQNDPPVLDLEEIDFSGSILESRQTPSSWWYSYDGLRADGYLSSTFALDLGGGGKTLEPVQNATIAYLAFSVPEDLKPGMKTEVRFEELPEAGGLPPIANEIVREIEGIPSGGFCSMQVCIVPRAEVFVRGDANRNWRAEISDVVEILRFLFSMAARELPCEDAADVDDNGRIDLTDPVILMRYLFLGGSKPYPPFAFASTDFRNDEDSLGCASLGV